MESKVTSFRRDRKTKMFILCLCALFDTSPGSIIYILTGYVVMLRFTATVAVSVIELHRVSLARLSTLINFDKFHVFHSRHKKFGGG